MKITDWLPILQKIFMLPPATQQKIFQLIGLVEELSQDPDLKAIIDSLAPAPQKALGQ